MTVTEQSAHRWWLAAILCVGLSLIVILLSGLSFNLYRTNQDYKRDIAATKAEIKLEKTKRLEAARTSDVTKVSQCFQQVNNAPNTRVLLDVLEITSRNSLESAQQALIQNPNDELNKIRLKTIKRLERATAIINRFRVEFERGLPKRAECTKQAKKLDIDPTTFKPVNQR